MPGRRPFVIERKKFDIVTRRINITNWKLAKSKEHGGIWTLRIEHETGKTRGHYTFFNLLQTKFAEGHYAEFKRIVQQWTRRQRKRKEEAMQTAAVLPAPADDVALTA